VLLCFSIRLFWVNSVTYFAPSGQRWLQEHEATCSWYAPAGPALPLARVRAEDIQHRPVLRPGDCRRPGAAPGGWSQYAAKLLQGRGRIVALDILPMDAINGVEFIQGDFSDDAVLEQLMTLLGADRPQVVMSDIAPNTTGIATVDQDRSMHLAELALDFAAKVLAPGGDFLVKVFQGRDFQPYVQRLRGLFGTVKVRKPPASRQRSPELYLLARTFNSG
jgi:23S rRNA (uridine2552-2'-O)-methyltransferase